jgi:hypothetical protein
MRTLRIAVLVAALAPAGCEWLKNTRDQPLPKPGGPVPKMQTSQLVAYLNQQANSLRTIEYSDVKLAATEAGRDYPTLRDCYLAAARPRFFRLECGTAFTSKELDLGSNDREFWMYAKRLDGPNYFFCSHDDFAHKAVRFPVPFDPDWVMMALGMTPYDPDGKYTLETDERRQLYVMRQETTTRQGQPVTKTTLFNVDWDYGGKPVVRGHQIQDAKGTVVCQAAIKSVKTVDPATGKAATRVTGFVQVPTHVTLEWPQQKFTMELDLRGERVNEDLGTRAAALFARPDIRGTDPIDLARYQVTAPAASRGQAPGEPRSWWRRN